MNSDKSPLPTGVRELNGGEPTTTLTPNGFLVMSLCGIGDVLDPWRCEKVANGGVGVTEAHVSGLNDRAAVDYGAM